ncbi:tRNA methyltransferase 10 homolog C [Lepisosteus oculatus]|uniref:tRNA methyltransferase 10 homolog C n=1 Tax=Lepisosteus oculatus TaxID=7918 RepID=UPI0035F51835
MKLLKPQFLSVVSRCCVPWRPALAGRRGGWLQRPRGPPAPCRALSASWGLRKEASQPSGGSAEGLDLGAWKAVARSEARGGASPEAGGQEGEPSPLQASRELVEMWRQAGKLVPEHLAEDELRAFGELPTKSARKKYLKYLAIKEGHKKARKEKKQHRASERAAEISSRDPETEEEPSGGRLRNTFLLQFWQRSVDALYNWRAAQAMQFGQPLVFDMSYDQHMSRREVENTVSQLLECEGWNRRSADPFHLYFCHLRPGSAYLQELARRYGPAWERLLVTATEQPHVDLFPRDRLVYLTADSPHVLRAFDHNKVYIVGAMVDRSIQTGLSLANAKRLKLATARLPLDEYLQWEIGAKNLTLDQVMRILLTMKDTGKWEEALRFVPSRKHDGFFEAQRQTQQCGRSGASFNKQRTFVRQEAFQPRARAAFKGSKSGETASRAKTKKSWWEED